MRTHSRLAAALLPLALLLFCALSACKSESLPPPEIGPSVSGNTVRFPGPTEGIRAEPVEDAGDTSLRLPGRLAWNEDLTVRVFSPFGGRVIRPLVQVGDRVRAGQPLAEMASAEYGEAVADARRAETEGRLARESLARLKDLGNAGLAARKDVIEAQAQASRSQIELQRAQTRLSQVGATGKGSNFVLRSPIDGVVVERSVNSGQELRADQSGGPPLFVITDPTQLWLWLDAPERALPRLAGAQSGMLVKITSGAWPDRVFEARLLRKEDSIDPATRTFRMRAEVDNPDRALKAEMFVSASLELPDNAEGRPIEHVSVAAVLLDEGNHYVFIQDGDNGYTRVPVEVVREMPGRVGLIGLSAGQQVVVEGNLYLQQILNQAENLQQTSTGGGASAPPGAKR